MQILYQFNVYTFHDNVACKNHILSAQSKSLVFIKDIMTEQVHPHLSWQVHFAKIIRDNCALYLLQLK